MRICFRVILRGFYEKKIDNINQYFSLFISCQADVLKENKVVSKNHNYKKQLKEEYGQKGKNYNYKKQLGENICKEKRIDLYFLINSLVELNNKAIDNSFEKFKSERSNQYNLPFKMLVGLR